MLETELPGRRRRGRPKRRFLGEVDTQTVDVKEARDRALEKEDPL